MGNPLETTPEKIAAIDIASVSDVQNGWVNLVSDK